MSNEELRISPTVYGIETEYSCTITYPGQIVHELVGVCHSPDTKLGLYVQPAERGTSGISEYTMQEELAADELLSTNSGMLSNGARFYIDPSGPEYSTAETRTAEEAVLRSFDGDAIMLRLFNRMRSSGYIEGFQFNRRIVDHNRTSRGIHINTATNLEVDEDDYIIDALAALNVAKGAMFGSGGLLLNGNGNTQFHHSPRLSLSNRLSAHYGDHTLRPLVRTPFKSDGKQGQLNRIETVTSDALTFAWPMKASMVITNALVKMLELGIRDLPMLRRPLRAADVVGLHGNGNVVSLIDKDGKFKGVRPAEILRAISEKALELDATLEFLDDESDQVLEEIIQTADDLKKDTFSAADRVESIARLTAMQRKMENKGVAIDSERMCKFDHYWDLMGDGLAERIRNKGVSWHGFSDTTTGKKATKRQLNPPADTRALVRAKEIRSKPQNNSSTWSEIDIDGNLIYFHPLKTTY